MKGGIFRTGLMVSVALLALIAIWLVAAQAQNAEPPRVTLSLQDKDVGEVFAQIATQGKVKIIPDSTVTGKINADMKDATVEKALAGICEPLKVEWRRLVVAPNSLATVNADTLSRMVRSLESASQMGLQVQNLTALQTINSAQQKATAETIAAPADKEVVYLVFDPARQPGMFRAGAGGNRTGAGGFGAGNNAGAGGNVGLGGPGNRTPVLSPDQANALRDQMRALRGNNDPNAWNQFRQSLSGLYGQLGDAQKQQVIIEGMMHSIFQGDRGGFGGRDRRRNN